MKELIKNIYNYIPFKKELFSIVKLFWTPPESVYQHLHFHGIISVPINKQKSFKINHYGYQIENEIFWVGLQEGWEKESCMLWLKLCEEAKTIIDIGANTGVYSLIAKTVNPNSRVFAFEPVNRVFIKLEENIKLNGFDIIAIEKAVSNTDGEAVIFDTYTDHVYSVTVNKNLAASETKVIETKIEVVTLNSIIKQYNIKNIDLIKIDVETHEPEVLEGFSEFLFAFKPTMLIEILNDEVGEKVENLVKGLGYLFFNIGEKTGIRQVERITKSDYYNYLLCSPQVAKKLGLV